MKFQKMKISQPSIKVQVLTHSNMIKLILFCAILNLCKANDAPIIGILTQPTTSYDVDTYIAGSYVKFLESAGARIIPIWINQTADYYQRVVNYTNGVLFPGGGASFHTVGGYGETAWKIYHIAKAANDYGRFYPLWGTCLGFEVLPLAETGEDIRVHCTVPDGSYSLNFTKNFNKSRLFSNIPDDVFDILSKRNVSYNAHEYCLTEKSLKQNQLDFNWHILTTNRDVNNLKFISSMEHTKYPFYGIQFHPEKNAFEFKDNEGFAHSNESVRIMQYFANFFVTETRKNNHTFPSRELEAKALIYNYCPQFTGLQDRYFYQLYGFENEDYTNLLL